MTYYQVNSKYEGYAYHRRNLSTGEITLYYRVLHAEEIFTKTEYTDLIGHSYEELPTDLFQPVQVAKGRIYVTNYNQRYILEGEGTTDKMKYYRVKEDTDVFRAEYGTPFRYYYRTLIRNELITEKELEKLETSLKHKLNPDIFEPVWARPIDTYKSFGARKLCSDASYIDNEVETHE